MSEENQHPPLGDTSTSKALRIGASVAGAVPFVGASIQTVLTEIIPNVRADRVESYIRHLQDQIDELKLKLALEKPEGLDLFEEGLWQSARAFTEERKKYIGELVISGLNCEEAEQHRVRHNLRILNQIGDDEILILSSYQSKYQAISSDDAKAFRKKHKSVLGPFSRALGSADRSKAAHKDALLAHLASFGLLKVTEEDFETSRVKHALTSQGVALLRYIGIAED
ncbi:hypothetical protein [Thalassospira lohafexi]|uniref:DUF4393 domain-containing protein n=1 Tax=Thalassospira lohafexi TaxID=744227 RepID=A0A2N3LB19_9PROT|nr:hypothetical protein [Thalassospira lohafexi]PKR59936.1 hypothetical protein COO92_00745 [Thalassospira lohafexi]